MDEEDDLITAPYSMTFNGLSGKPVEGKFKVMVLKDLF